jgi:hypothetical protein
MSRIWPTGGGGGGLDPDAIVAGSGIIKTVDGDQVTIAASPGKVGGLFVWTHSYGQLSGIPGAGGLGGNERAGNFTRRFAAALGIPSSEILLIGKSGAQAGSPEIGASGEQQGVGAILRWWSPQHLYSGMNPATRSPAMARGAFCVVMLGVNDAGNDATVYATFGRNAYKNGMRTAISRLLARSVWFYNDTDAAGEGGVAYTGTWSDVATTMASRGTVKRTSTINDLFTITLPKTFQGGVVGIVFHGNLNGSVANKPTTGTTVTFSGTAGVTGTLSLAGQGTNGKRIQVTHRVSLAATAAGKTIIGTLTALNGGETLDFDSFHIEDADHPGVMVMNQPLGWYAAAPASFFAPHNFLLLDPIGYNFNDYLDEVVAEFTNSVFLCDLETWFDDWFKCTLSGALAANATPNLAGQTVRIIPDNASLCRITVGSILRTRGFEEILIESIDTTNGGLNDGKWLLSATRNYQQAEAGNSATTNVATGNGEALFDQRWQLPDRIHPSDYGHALLAERMIEAFATQSYTSADAARSGQFALSDHPKPPDGDCYYFPRNGTWAQLAPADQADDELQVTRLRIDEIGLLTQVRCEVRTAGGASRTLRMAVFADGEGKPGNLILDSGAIAANTTGVKTYDCWIPVNRGYVWVGLAQQGSGTRANITAVTAITEDQGILTTATGFTGAATGNINALLKTGVTGAMPDPFGTPTSLRRGTTGANGAPMIELVVSHPFR